MPSRFWTAFTLGCVSHAGARGQIQNKESWSSIAEEGNDGVRFGVPLEKAFRGGVIPTLLVDLLVYLSREGVITRDVFRRSGNNRDVKRLVQRLSEGKPTNFGDYSIHTLTSVVKKFLLDIPGGIFGTNIEEQLLSILKFTNHSQRFTFVNMIVVSLPKEVQQFVVLLFGIWFRIVNHNELNSITSEAMAKSVTGCIFRNSAGNPDIVKSAAKVMEILIDDFAIPSMFGSDNLQYFADTTCSGILVQENFSFDYCLPQASCPDSFSNAARDDGPQQDASVMNRESGDGGAFGMKHVTAAPQQWPPGNTALIPSHVADRNQLPALCSSAPDINLPLSTQQSFSSMQRLDGVDSSGSSCKDQSLRASTPGAVPARSHYNQYYSKSMSHIDPVLSRQLARMEKRSQWFMASSAHHAVACEPACDSLASGGTLSQACWPSDCASRQDGAAGFGGDCATITCSDGDWATVVSSDDALSVFTDLDDSAGCSEVAHVGAVSNDDPALAVNSNCSSIKRNVCDGTTTLPYCGETYYAPKAVA